MYVSNLYNNITKKEDKEEDYSEEEDKYDEEEG